MLADWTYTSHGLSPCVRYMEMIDEVFELQKQFSDNLKRMVR